MIDADGFRANVGIIIANDAGRLFWARRVGQTGWQFPQGGIGREESLEDALFRELQEETGLTAEHVEILGRTRRWLRYRLPKQYLRHDKKPLCIGQKQRWYLLRLTGEESDVNLTAGEVPEFEHWRWVDYWEPMQQVIYFKQRVYRQALEEFAPLLFPEGAPPIPEHGAVTQD